MVDFGGILAGAIGGAADGYVDEKKRAVEAKRKANLQRLADLGAEIRQEKQNIYQEGRDDKQLTAAKEAAALKYNQGQQSETDKLSSNMVLGDQILTRRQYALLNDEDKAKTVPIDVYKENVKAQGNAAKKSDQEFELFKQEEKGKLDIKTAEARNEGRYKGSGILNEKFDNNKFTAEKNAADKTLGMVARNNDWILVKGSKIDEAGDVIEAAGDLETVLIKKDAFKTSNMEAIEKLGYDVAAKSKTVKREDGDYIAIQIGGFRQKNKNESPVEGDGNIDYGKFSTKREPIGEPLDASAELPPKITEPLDSKSAVKEKGTPILGPENKKIPTQEAVKAATERLIGKKTLAGRTANLAGKAQTAIKDTFTGTKEDPPFWAVGAKGNSGEKQKDYGLRNDGKTQKGNGWLGVIKSDSGKDMTEYTIGVNFDGKEIDIPTLVPGLTQKEIDFLKTEPSAKEIMDSTIKDKAIKHALRLLKAGKSPFKEEGK